MRRKAKALIETLMEYDPRIVIVTGDLGYGMWDSIRARFPDRFYNTGAAEQAMMGVAVGLALAGKRPLVYSITPFLLARPFETIRNYLDHEKIPVVLLGGGRNDDYTHDGFSHWAGDDKNILSCFPNIECFWPETDDELKGALARAMTAYCAVYINLRR